MPDMPEPQEPRRSGPRPVSFAVKLFRPLARAWIGATRFKIEGELPDIPKYVVVAAPHTTNWDFPHALSAGIIYGRAINWMGKDSLFKFPIGGIMRWLGGVSIDRSKANNKVQATIDEMKARDEIALVITPSGTRSSTMEWKSGYYWIAHGAGVPIVCCFIDYKRRAIGVAGQITTTGDYAADFERIKALYAAKIDMKAAGWGGR
jgi:1-acyl-sn-glycerol-3-phosphate acyltransferase